MYELLVTILSSAAVSGALTAALVWLFQSWMSERLKNAIKHEYDIKLESHKAELKAGLDTELEAYKAKLSVDNAAATERLKSDLQIAATEQQIRFTKLHEKVAEVVAEIYSRLYDYTLAVDGYVSELESAGNPPKSELRKKVVEAMNRFTEYVRPHLLYLPKDVADQTQSFAKRLYKWAAEFKVGVEEGGDARFPGRDTWGRIVDEMHVEAPRLFGALEEEFRKILGVQVKASKKTSS
jgi:hypothetical protein